MAKAKQRKGIILYLNTEMATAYNGVNEEGQPISREVSSDEGSYEINKDGSVTCNYETRGKIFSDTFLAGTFVLSSWEETAEGAESREARAANMAEHRAKKAKEEEPATTKKKAKK